ncbi:MAG: choice-of-anchor D domain-containing protein, partial [Acidimicrobiales bacterium]
TQQGSKLTGMNSAFFGAGVALSEDGNTALIGAPVSGGGGAAWAFMRSGSTWTPLGSKLTGKEETGDGDFGTSVALSGNGETALIGGSDDNEDRGSAWAFTRSGETWTQQGGKLIGAGEVGEGRFGTSVALSADGNTALIGGPYDNRLIGSAWVFTRSDSTWVPGATFTGMGGNETRMFGTSVALSGDGDTALIGEPWDNNLAGAAWEFTRSGSSWTQQGSKLNGADELGSGELGAGVALSGDGSTALVGGSHDNGGAGAVWAYVFLQIAVPSELSFGAQTVGQPGSVLWLSVQNTGQAPLTFGGEAQIGGTDAGDFTIPSGDDLCENATLDPGQGCRIGVQFMAAAGGARSATLSFATGNPHFVAPTVSLTGSGVATSPESGGGGSATSGTGSAQSSAGTQGSVGSTVTPGSTVALGSAGPAGEAGKVELVTCKPVKGKQRCTAKLVSGTIKLEAARLTARAVLSQKGRVVATGTVRTVDSHVEFMSNSSRILPRGRYTLTITRKAGRHITETREAITIT